MAVKKHRGMVALCQSPETPGVRWGGVGMRARDPDVAQGSSHNLRSYGS